MVIMFKALSHKGFQQAEELVQEYMTIIDPTNIMIGQRQEIYDPIIRNYISDYIVIRN